MRHAIVVLLMLFSSFCFAQVARIQPGAEQSQLYLPLLAGKRVGVVANQTSQVGKNHLVDFLLQHHVAVKKIFAPEHGFRGNVDAAIKNSVDTRTGLPIISLYGKKFTPNDKDLKDIDVLIFDIQDVGVRFYTYISSLQKLMQAAAEHHIPFIILDRPNPNGFLCRWPRIRYSLSFVHRHATCPHRVWHDYR